MEQLQKNLHFQQGQMGNRLLRSLPLLNKVFPALLQKEGEETIVIIRRLFRVSFEWMHIPPEWRTFKVIFIQKAGKAEIFQVNKFDFVLFDKFQYAYQQGKSTTNALTKPLKDKKVAVRCSLDKGRLKIPALIAFAVQPLSNELVVRSANG